MFGMLQACRSVVVCAVRREAACLRCKARCKGQPNSVVGVRHMVDGPGGGA